MEVAEEVVTLHTDLLEAINLDAWERVSVSEIELNAKADTPEWLGAYDCVYVGGDSITIKDTRQKLLTWRTFPVTNGELAREYLRQVFPPRKEHETPLMANPANVGFLAKAPLFCEPVRHRPLAYVDIESAYWQLISCYRPDDMPFPSSRSVNAGTLEWWRPDEVRQTRGLRHAIAGSMWSNRIEWCNRGTWRETLATSRWSNPWIKRHVMHTLHAVVWDLMGRVNLHAWLTDAAIVDADDATEVVDRLARHWHLTSRVVASGAGAVWNVTSYVVGEKRSLNIEHGHLPADGAAFSNLTVPEEGVTWLADERGRVTS